MVGLEGVCWADLVFNIHEYRYHLEQNKQFLSKKEYKKINEKIRLMWLRVWDFHPDTNDSMKELFKLNFH